MGYILGLTNTYIFLLIVSALFPPPGWKIYRSGVLKVNLGNSQGRVQLQRLGSQSITRPLSRLLGLHEINIVSGRWLYSLETMEVPPPPGGAISSLSSRTILSS